MPDEYGAPDLGEEIERKARQYILDTATAAQDGTITMFQLSQRMDALWGAVAGLVPKELMEEITGYIEVGRDAAAADSLERLIIGNEHGQVWMIERDLTRPRVRLVDLNTRQVKKVWVGEREDTQLEAREVVEKMHTRLANANGMREIV